MRKIFNFAFSGLRPILGPASCKYPVGCTEYALQLIEKQGFFKSFLPICTRIFSCNPFTTKINFESKDYK